jgi:uncharacterized flavoprotein (TIGR03862 family)
VNLAIVGGGPSGLRAAEILAETGATVTLFEGKVSVGRKFLVAGRGGLNLTHSESLEDFSKRYKGGFSEPFWTSLLEDCTPLELRKWAEGLGIDTFIGTSGRVFPKEFKAAPLLRRWVENLRSRKVIIQTRHNLQSIKKEDGRILLELSGNKGVKESTFDAVILALGGASWPETGSDARWVPILKEMGISITPLQAANCGWEVNWHPDILSQAEGQPLKNLSVTAGQETVQGELMITAYGLEGGAIYQLGASLRSMELPRLLLDLKPTYSEQELVDKLGDFSGDLVSIAAKSWRLSTAATALFRNLTPKDAENDPLALARLAKKLPISLKGPRPIAEAISSAGGIHSSEITEDLMIRKFPGLFVAGEMIDWEAPTGGYLLQGCFATGTRAAQGLLRYLTGRNSP